MSLIATLERAVVALERIANALEESEQDQRNRIVALRVTSDVTSLAEMFLRQIRDGNPLAMATALRLAEAVLAASNVDSESRTA